MVYVFNPSAGLSPLHVFRGEPTDGAAPATDLTVRHGTLFGATRAGGTYGSGDDGGGTVFKITPGAGQHTLFTFFGDQQMNNGTTPLGAPTFGGKLFYGTLASQGANLGGQIFSTDGQGHVTYLYSFPTLSQMPLGDFLNVHGQLYGVTDAGGAHGCGEVYRLDPSDSSVHVLYSFGGKPDGCGPTAGVTYLHGKFFGTTSRGGAHAAGTIYELRTDGTEHVAHSFGEPHDGAHPAAALIAIGSTLYGTTQDGGLWDQGTVFAFTPGPN